MPKRILILFNIILSSLSLVLVLSSLCSAADYYDWSSRVDRDGKPAGVFDTTPFPVTEASTSYTITNDEGAATFVIDNTGAHMFFVDASLASTCTNGTNTKYNPTTKDCTGNTYKGYKTIAEAITASAAGNDTILVRGGTYTITAEINLSARSGSNNSHRFSIIGYNQERPVLDATGQDTIVINSNYGEYITLQRLKVQNGNWRGIRVGGTNYYNIIDVWVYNNCAQCYIGGTAGAEDSNIYFQGDETVGGSPLLSPWIYHVTSEHTYMKCMKFTDNVHNAIIEWSKWNECGYWSGISHTPYGHAYGLDFASLTDAITEANENGIIRYNIGGTCLMGNECRSCKSFSIHHNEFYDSVNLIQDAGYAWGQHANFNFRRANSSGSFYSNVVRDNKYSGNADVECTTGLCTYLFSVVGQNSASSIKVYNNLFYSQHPTTKPFYIYAYDADGVVSNVEVYNNTFYLDSGSNTILVNDAHSTGDIFISKNNIFYHNGTGACVSYGDAFGAIRVWKNNLYYYPSGSRGYANPLETGGVIADPKINIPRGSYVYGYGKITIGSPAKSAAENLSITFNTDFNLNLRPAVGAWAIGVNEEYSPIITSSSTPESSSTSSSTRCFIATAVYGSNLDPHVNVSIGIEN